MAFILPDWGLTIRGKRYTVNPGPWTSKEQLFATIIFSGASTIGNFTGLLVMRLPIFFNQRWANFGFAIVLALANQFFTAIRLFNWMTWISPENKNLAIVTGSYGGMGFNPLSSWDPNVSGSSVMQSPFFA